MRVTKLKHVELTYVVLWAVCFDIRVLAVGVCTRKQAASSSKKLAPEF